MEESWTGYGVIQAKFLQRPLGTTHDGSWALEQLREELAQYEAGKRRMPDYYIFATNASLSAVPQVGHRDAVEQLLLDFQERQRLAGFDIWDLTKLSAFLNVHSGVRQSYDAWLTPGDVLRRVIERLPDSPPNFEDFLVRLLSRELIADQHTKLEQSGYSGDDRVPLANVFVDLPISINSGSPETTQMLIQELVRQGNDKLDPAHLNSEHDEGHRAGRVVVIGGPGQGKTTVGQYLCQLYRAALLLDVPGARLDPDVRTIALKIEEHASEDETAPRGCRRFPVHIILNKLASYLAQAAEGEASVGHFLARQMSNRLNDTITPKAVMGWLATYPWLIILDGLDEVPASSNREQVLEAVRAFLIDVRSAEADLLLVATTRPQGYNSDFSAKRYQHQYLQQLTPLQALRYAKRLVGSRHGAGNERAQAILDRLDRATNQESTARLMRSPLQVTIMSLLLERAGQPPQEQWTLFDQYYSVIYSRELERDTPAARVLRDYRADIDAIHRQVGLALHVRAERAGGTESRLSSDEFRRIVVRRLEEEGTLAMSY